MRGKTGSCRPLFFARQWLALLVLLATSVFFAPSANAASCGAATTQGTAPNDYKNYCWLDFTGYNDSSAKSAAGQSFSFTLPDGSNLTLTLNVTNSTRTGTALEAVATPSWTGAAFGNSAFIGIPGKPVLYQVANGDTTTVTLSNIAIVPPGGGSGTKATYAFIAADGESTNSDESLSFTTNGSAWTELSKIANGTYYPTVAGTGTATVTETGTESGNAGSFVFGSFNNPTTITAKLVGDGLQGVTFAVRFASVSVTTVINGTRVSASDQFTYSIDTTGGTVLASQASTGTGAGPFTIANVPTVAASYPFVVSEVMASGSASTLANYSESLTCTNGSTAGSTTVMPTKVNATTYTFPALLYGDAIACVFTNTPSATGISGTVYNDANHNGQLDPGESGTGVTGLYVKLATSVGGVCQAPALSAVAVTTATGVYTFAGIGQGTYCLILDNNNTLTDITPSVPAGWVGTQAGSGIVQVTQGAASLTAQNFGLYDGSSFTGTIFGDTGVGSGTANNGMQDGGEVGLAGVTVNALSGTTSEGTATTNGNGLYTLWIPATMTGSVAIAPVAPSGDLATGGSAGSSGGTYTRPSVIVTLTATSGLSATGVNFGLVPPNTLAPNGNQAAAPGTVVFYAHTFVAGSAGQVTFSTAATPTPTLAGWVETLYRDSNCNGQLDSGEPQITAPITVTAGQTVCVLVKEFVPANAPVNAMNQVVLTASFNYTNASPALSATQTRTDTTTVTGSGVVVLSKQVADITQGGAAGTSNNAAPGDTLQYQLTISNPGSLPVNQLIVNDVTPSFTLFVSAACPAASSLPAGLTACSVSQQPAAGTQGALAWTLAGSLAPGAKVSVSYDVTVSP